MKLINTDGMALIGPGSEWLWAALTGLVLAGTGVAIFRQLRMQRLQIHDNTKLLRSQAHYNAMLLGQRPWEMLIENEGLASVMNVAYATPEAVSADDWSPPARSLPRRAHRFSGPGLSSPRRPSR